MLQLIVDPFVELRVRVAPADEFHLSRQVGFVVQQDAVRWQSIAAGSADFLVPRFHRTGNLGMNHIADVLLINPHSECIRRQHQRTIPPHELVLNSSTVLTLQVTVVTDMGNSQLSQLLAESLQRSNQREVNGPAAGIGFVTISNRLDLLEFVVIAPNLAHIEHQIGAIDSFQERFGVVWQSQLTKNVLPHFSRRSGGQRDRCWKTKTLAKFEQPSIVRSKVMSPFTDAVRFIDRQQHDLSPRNHIQKL